MFENAIPADGKTKEDGVEKNFEKIIAQIFPNIESQNVSSKNIMEISKKILMPKHITDNAKY